LVFLSISDHIQRQQLRDWYFKIRPRKTRKARKKSTFKQNIFYGKADNNAFKNSCLFNFTPDDSFREFRAFRGLLSTWRLQDAKKEHLWGLDIWTFSLNTMIPKTTNIKTAYRKPSISSSVNPVYLLILSFNSPSFIISTAI